VTGVFIFQKRKEKPTYLSNYLTKDEAKDKTT
jgi:hypothetical protein